jgi:Zn finger protein HypA/HybF involved in hydrogenase expression
MKSIKCHNCDHEWKTKSEHVFVSCPSCMGKTKNVEKEVQENEDNTLIRN